jgi:hypothetical protein
LALKNVRIESKGERPKHMDTDLYEYSSDITEFNLYDQDWADIVDCGLEWVFQTQAEFERLKLKRELDEYAEINT